MVLTVAVADTLWPGASGVHAATVVRLYSSSYRRMAELPLEVGGFQAARRDMSPVVRARSRTWPGGLGQGSVESLTVESSPQTAL